VFVLVGWLVGWLTCTKIVCNPNLSLIYPDPSLTPTPHPHPQPHPQSPPVQRNPTERLQVRLQRLPALRQQQLDDHVRQRGGGARAEEAAEKGALRFAVVEVDGALLGVDGCGWVRVDGFLGGWGLDGWVWVDGCGWMGLGGWGVGGWVLGG